MGCGGRVLHTDTAWSHPAVKTPLQRRPWAPGDGQEAAGCPDQADGMGCTSRVTEVILPFPHTGAVPRVTHTDTAQGHEGIQGLQHLSYKERLRQQGLFNQKEAQGDSYQTHTII